MQAINSTVQQVKTVARPASGSAFLAGHVVTVTVPLLAMGDGLLAIGDEWSELLISDETTGPSGRPARHSANENVCSKSA